MLQQKQNNQRIHNWDLYFYLVWTFVSSISNLKKLQENAIQKLTPMPTGKPGPSGAAGMLLG